MKIKNFIRKWLNSDDKVPQLESNSVEEDLSPDDRKCIHFKVWFAQGGQVIQTRRYDSIKDRLYTAMYVIHDNENIGEKLNEIIIKESLYQ
jgi:hypothetical protein